MNRKKNELKVTKTRKIIMYSDLWMAANSVLEKGRADKHGSAWQFLSALVLQAFTVEAYLNHVGQKLREEDWETWEKKPPLEKLKSVCEELGLTFVVKKNARPWQTLKSLFEFRNQMAHGKTQPCLKVEKKLRAAAIATEMGSDLLDRWETCIQDVRFADRCREDVEQVLRLIHEKLPDASEREKLFSFGEANYGTEPIEEWNKGLV